MKHKDATNVAVIGAGSEAADILSTLCECPTINVVGFCDPHSDPSSTLIAQELNTPLFESIEQLPAIGDVDVIVDISDGQIDINSIEGLSKVQVVRGKAADVIKGLALNGINTSDKLDSMLAASSEFGTMQDSRELYQAIVENALKVVGCAAGTLIIFSEREEICHLAGVAGYSKTINVKSWELQPGGITEQLLDEDAPIIIQNINEEPLFDNPVMNEGTVSVLATSLKQDSEVIGLLFIGDFKLRHFSEQELFLFSAYARLASLALQKAMLLEKNEELTVTDNLTGLYNSRHFFATLEAEMARAKRYGGGFAILLMDVDGLDFINNYFGYSKGDWVLKKVADVLKSCSRQTDYKARYGGDEFVMLLPSTSCGQASILANRIKREVSDLVIREGGQEFRLSISIGIAEFPCLGKNCDELMNAVSTALYICKQRGKNLVCCYEDTGTSK